VKGRLRKTEYSEKSFEKKGGESPAMLGRDGFKMAHSQMDLHVRRGEQQSLDRGKGMRVLQDRKREKSKGKGSSAVGRDFS